MTPEEIRTAIMTQLATWTTTEIAWPNRVFDPAANQYWIEADLRFSQSRIGEMGPDGIGHRSGVLIIRHHAPKDQGLRTAMMQCASLELLFRRADLDGVRFDEPSTDVVGMLEERSGNNFYLTVINIPFETFIGE